MVNLSHAIIFNEKLIEFRQLVRKHYFVLVEFDFAYFDGREGAESDVFTLLRLCERDFNDEFHWRSLAWLTYRGEADAMSSLVG